MTDNTTLEFFLTFEQAAQRLDKLLCDLLPDVTRSRIQKLIAEGNVAVDGVPARKQDKPGTGAHVVVTLPPVQEMAASAQNIPLDIRYEDDDLLVVNKPRGMVVHPAAGNPDGTLVNALLFYCKGSLSGINGVLRPGIVHRIDKDTSGLLLVAKNDFAHTALARQIQAHSLLREYRAVVYGHMPQQEGTVDAAIGRSTKDRKKMTVQREGGRNAVTHYSVLEEFPGFTYLRLRLETGRTHQIRVHMAHLGHPVAGDPLYGPKRNTTGLQGQCLHAAVLGFLHPRDQREISLQAELPDDFSAFLDQLRTIT